MFAVIPYTRAQGDAILYEPLVGVPDGIEIADARLIADENCTRRFIYKGKPDLSHFSDYFRYNLSLKTDNIWIDTDMLMVSEVFEPVPEFLIAKESASMICPAILRLPQDDLRLNKLIAVTESKMGRNLVWGETGPKLMTTVFGSDLIMQKAMSPRMFFPFRTKNFGVRFFRQSGLV